MASKGPREPDGEGRQSVSVTSWEDLQREVAPIVDRINADQSLALAAAANPLFALEELGFEIDPDAQPEIEDRLRFRPPDAERLGKLRRDLHRQAGGPFDPASDADVRRVLTAAGVKVGRIVARERPPLAFAPRQADEPQPKGASAKQAEPDHAADPFERLRGEHPLIEPLLEYRRLEASEPRLAARDVYKALREGSRSVPVTRLRAVIKPNRKR